MQDTMTIYGPDVLNQYVRAVMEGRWATAEYLRGFLPEVDLEGYMRTSQGLAQAACAGECGR